MTATAELVPIADVDRAAVTAEMVTNALVESKSWLAVAMKGTDPTPIVEFRAWAATVAEATRQKQLGHEIELDAAEMVRRAERGIGVAVRNGQAAGDIRRPSQEVGGRDLEQISAVSPAEFFTGSEERTQTYAMTDNVTDKEFDEAIEDARAEKNLSRANVVRKIRNEPPSRPSTADSTPGATAARYRQIAEMARAGHTSHQIAARLGYAAETVRAIARREGTDIPADKVATGAGRISATRVIEQTVIELAGLATGINEINIEDADPSRAAEWVSSLTESLRSLNRLKKELTQL